ncbi:MAG: ATP synthase F1 subunit epsilon [Candidatus Obscuribacterales bacterium]|nr:ATP synthase F1 subunit epsilon [Cyanobacteria bacterium HKST-UBA01]MCB9471133.1 ATP synthase F1 subunit epsilon [Candidatus Obscuribacterales bacterium]
MASKFKLNIITPERVVLETEAEKLTATAVDGELTILPNHEPLVTALGIDILRYTKDGVEESAAVIGGILEVNNEEVHVLSNVAELGVEIDQARANDAKARAEAEKTQKTDKLDTYLTEMALARAIARLKAVEFAQRRKKNR